MSENTNKFVNPWPFATEYDSNTQGTISSVIPLSEKQFIQSLCPTKGALQIVINRLWQQLTISLKQNGITTIADAEQFKQFIANVRVSADGFGEQVIPIKHAHEQVRSVNNAAGVAIDRAVSEARAHDDRGRVKATSGEHTQSTDESRNVPSQDERGRKTKRSGGGVTGKRERKPLIPPSGDV